jgi:hypothetical protein
MTRSKEMRRIEAAIAHRNEAELRWALGQCELARKFREQFGTRHSSRWYRIEKEIRVALDSLKERE